MYNLGVLGHFPHWGNMGLGVLESFGQKQKIDKIRKETFWSGGIRIFWAQKIRQEKFIKIFELHQVFMYQNVSILPYSILLTRTKSITQ